MQGEMGATAFYHPVEWMAVIGRVRERIAKAAGIPVTSPLIEVGVGVNNNKLCGCALLLFMVSQMIVIILEIDSGCCVKLKHVHRTFVLCFPNVGKLQAKNIEQKEKHV